MIPVWVLRWLPTAVLVAVLTAGVAYGVHFLREQGRNELRPKVAELESLLAAEKNARQRAENAANAYFSELGHIARRPVPRTPVRLCVTPSVPDSPAVGADGAAPSTGVNGSQDGANLDAGPDIGPELYGLAQSCDAEIAKLRALQGWINDVR